jgi:hypothetical protein
MYVFGCPWDVFNIVLRCEKLPFFKARVQPILLFLNACKCPNVQDLSILGVSPTYKTKLFFFGSKKKRRGNLI